MERPLQENDCINNRRGTQTGVLNKSQFGYAKKTNDKN